MCRRHVVTGNGALTVHLTYQASFSFPIFFWFRLCCFVKAIDNHITRRQLFVCLRTGEEWMELIMTWRKTRDLDWKNDAEIKKKHERGEEICSFRVKVNQCCVCKWALLALVNPCQLLCGQWSMQNCCERNHYDQLYVERNQKWKNKVKASWACCFPWFHPLSISKGFVK